MFSLSENGEFYVTPRVKAAFEEHGYVLVRGLFNDDEVSKLRDYLEANSDIKDKTYGRSDGRGRRTKVALWNKAGDDLAGVVARSRKVAGTMQDLLGGEEVYHYHSKLIMKDAKTGGAHVWHQDYGYWYNNGCLFPDMGSVFMPVDKCTIENGCLHVLDGSHKMGRINHILEGDQAGADPERLKQAMEVFPLVALEMEAGDGLFFHCNLLHTSAQNNSLLRRWVMISSFNQRRNNPVIKHHHPLYHPLGILPNSSISSCRKMSAPLEDKDFLDPQTDQSAKKNEEK